MRTTKKNWLGNDKAQEQTELDKALKKWGGNSGLGDDLVTLIYGLEKEYVANNLTTITEAVDANNKWYSGDDQAYYNTLNKDQKIAYLTAKRITEAVKALVIKGSYIDPQTKAQLDIIDDIDEFLAAYKGQGSN